jgi:hypothetical protein
MHHVVAYLQWYLGLDAICKCVSAYGLTSARSASPFAPLIPFRTPDVSCVLGESKR